MQRFRRLAADNSSAAGLLNGAGEADIQGGGEKNEKTDGPDSDREEEDYKKGPPLPVLNDPIYEFTWLGSWTTAHLRSRMAIHQRVLTVPRKPVEVGKRWEEYFKELRTGVQEEQQAEGPIPSWTQEELRNAIGKMKLGKAAGLYGVPVEAWKVLGNCGVNWLSQFFNRVTIEGKMPDDWRNSIKAPIFKQNGDASECSNCRGIKLISHTMKV
ncbi:unnamed protein product [Heligmosomoides polygyrus]|uniref:HTH CENPB-type domain-containing protein n=1 Tax=Heligmosomoides polygyrus TaxID=6339 RepID=A0A3P8B6M2_HELPZ|nr:unnamed protein product [Heligmosomoides polygyrus]